MRDEVAIIVLAAGKGTRMCSDLPKVLHPLGGRPMLTYVMDAARAIGPQHICVVTSPDNHGRIEAALAPCPTTTFAVQEQQLGTAHAVLAARKALGDFKGIALVLFGDTPRITLETLQTLAQSLKNAPPATVATVVGMDLDDAKTYGRIITHENTIEKIVEHSAATPAERTIRLCNSGVMALRCPDVWPLLEAIQPQAKNGEYYLTDLVTVARAQGREAALMVTPAPQTLEGINSKAELAATEAVLQDEWRARHLANGVTMIDPQTVYFSADTQIAADVTLHPNIVFGPGVVIRRGATIRAFCDIEGAEIGENASVGPFARLRPETVLGEDVRIGNFVEVKNARLNSGVKANHLTYLGDATIGARTNIGAGTITCNYDGFSKSHTTIGADVSMGANTSLIAPITIGDGACIGAGSTLTKNVESDALAVCRGTLRTIDQGAKMRRARKEKPTCVAS